MGMRIGGASQGSAAQATGAAHWQQRQQGVKDLMAALQAGDLGAAQKAWAGLGNSSGGTRANGPLAAIGQAVQKGDLAAAQQAAQAWQAARSGHHHERMASATPATTTVSTDPSGGPGSLVDLKA